MQDNCVKNLRIAFVFHQVAYVYISLMPISYLGTFLTSFNGYVEPKFKGMYSRLDESSTSLELYNLVALLRFERDYENPFVHEMNSAACENILPMCQSNVSSIPPKLDCCCSNRACDYGKQETIFNVVKASSSTPHILDFGLSDNVDAIFDNAIAAYNKYNLTSHPFVKPNTSDQKLPYILNPYPFIPLCRFQDNWNFEELKIRNITPDIPYCSSFRPSFTDDGICYSFNGNTDSYDILKESNFKQTISRVFGNLSTNRSLFYSSGTGTKNGFTFVLDSHSTTTKFIRGKNGNKIFKLALHSADTLPPLALESLEIEAGYRTTLVVTPTTLTSTDDVFALDIEGLNLLNI
jgi:hypothetical protein